MVAYSTVNVKLTERQLKQLKTAVKNKTRTTLRMSWKMFDENDASCFVIENETKNEAKRCI